MKQFRAWIDGLLQPRKSNLEDGTIDDIHQALSDQTVRHYWIKSLEDELWQLNIKIDRVMEDDQETEWKKLSMRRNAIIFVMNKILDARNLIESEREEQERQNRVFESYRGTASGLPLDNRANNLARD